MAPSAARTTSSAGTCVKRGLGLFAFAEPRRATSMNSVSTGPGQSAVTRNARAPHFAAEAFGKTGDVSLGRGVNRKVQLIGRNPSGGADIQDRAALLRDHRRQQGPRESVSATMFTANISLTRSGSAVANDPRSPRPALLIRKFDPDVSRLPATRTIPSTSIRLAKDQRRGSEPSDSGFSSSARREVLRVDRRGAPPG